MDYRFDDALPVLRRTPTVLRALLFDLPRQWIAASEGPGTWTPFDIVGHLIHGERTDWVPRVEHMLRHGDAVPFPAFDREAMFAASEGLSLEDLLDTFGRLRAESLDRLTALGLTDADLARHGRHPQFGLVTLGQHLATWVAHDLNHVGQVVRVMARQYSATVGPWKTYLSILRSHESFTDVARLQQFATMYTAAWCSQHPASVAAFFEKDGSLQINDGVPSAGRTAITAAAHSFMTALPDMVVAMDDVAVEGNHTVYRWTLTGTNTGPGGTGRTVRISGFERWTIGTQGLIAESKGYFDEAEYQRQLKVGGP